MKRTFLLLLLIACLSVRADSKPDSAISVEIGPGRELTVTVPNIAPVELREIVSTFFGRGDEAAKKKFSELLGKSSNMTLVLTTKTQTTNP